MICSARVTFALAAFTASVCAHAALPNGAAAPDFGADAAVGGQAFHFALSDSLKNGPVVLYFFPKAFTAGCTVEAHQFAEATDEFKALGASVIGMSGDNIDTLKKFSVEACRNKFPVAADADARVMKLYDVKMPLLPSISQRVSFVISPQGKVLYSFDSMSPDGHVPNLLKAVQQWRKANPR